MATGFMQASGSNANITEVNDDTILYSNAIVYRVPSAYRGKNIVYNTEYFKLKSSSISDLANTVTLICKKSCSATLVLEQYNGSNSINSTAMTEIGYTLDYSFVKDTEYKFSTTIKTGDANSASMTVLLK